ncbi:MAG TPA: hypothetical protein VGJ93_05750 [Desulfuromonadaceae bacterium]|jgi:hypothetical protein
MVNKNYRLIFVANVTALACLYLATFMINAFYDPLCCFLLFPSANRPVPVVDSRLQKTNHLVHGPANHSALLLGSSRAEQLRQQDFTPLRTFNYAAPSFYPDEASEYLDFFIKKNSVKPTTVFLGLDFYGSNLLMHEHAKPPRHYIETCSYPLGAFKTAVSHDTLKYSLRVAKGKRDMFMYDPLTLDKLTIVQGAAESDKLLRRQLEVYRKEFYGDYRYNENYAATLRKLKDGHPDLQFVVFTTPVSKQLFKLLVASGRIPDYERWLKDVVDIFGSVYNFMIIDPLTSNQGNFLDAHHLYPERSAPVARIVSGHPQPQDKGIGRLVTTRNISAHIAEVRAQVKQLTQEKQP